MCIEDGIAYIGQKEQFEQQLMTKHEFGRLVFVLDTRNMALHDATFFIDEMREIDNDIKLFINCDLLITFDYFITTDLLPQIKALVDSYCNTYYQGKLKYFKYSNK